MHRRIKAVLACAIAAGLAIALVPASSAAAAPTAPASRTGEFFPTTIALPNGFQPEGIAIGVLPFAFFGSLANGDLYRVNLRHRRRARSSATGPGTPSRRHEGRPSGPAVRGRRSWRQRPGRQRHHRRRPGELHRSPPRRPSSTTWCSRRMRPGSPTRMKPVLYKVPLGPFGALPDQAAVQTVPLTGAYVHQPGFNANGIARTPDRHGAAHRAVGHRSGVPGRPGDRRDDHSGPRRLRGHQR